MVSDDSGLDITRVYAEWNVMIYGPSLTMDMLLATNRGLLEGLQETVGVDSGVLFRCDHWVFSREPSLCLHLIGESPQFPVSAEAVAAGPLCLYKAKDELEFGLRYHVPAISVLLDRAMALDSMAAEVAVVSDVGEKVTYHGDVGMAMRLTTSLNIASVASAAPATLREQTTLSELFNSKEK